MSEQQINDLFQILYQETGSGIFSLLFIVLGGGAFIIFWRFANIHLKGLEKRVENESSDNKTKFADTKHKLDELTKEVNRLEDELLAERLSCDSRLKELENGLLRELEQNKALVLVYKEQIEGLKAERSDLLSRLTK